MRVATYRGSYEENAIVVLGGKRAGLGLAVHAPPGTWVQNVYRFDSFGLLVANTDDSLTVLWSDYGT